MLLATFGFPSISPTTGAGWAGFFGSLILTTVIAFVASFIWGKKVEAGNTEEAEAPAAAPVAAAAPAAAAPAVAAEAGESVEIGSHMVGSVVLLADVKDPHLLLRRTGCRHRSGAHRR